MPQPVRSVPIFYNGSGAANASENGRRNGFGLQETNPPVPDTTPVGIQGMAQAEY